MDHFKNRAGTIPAEVMKASSQKNFSGAQMGGEFLVIRKGQVRVANPRLYTKTAIVADIAASVMTVDSAP